MELFIFCWFLVVPVDKSSSVSPHVRLHVPSISLTATRRPPPPPGGERVAAPEMDLQLVAEAIGIQPGQTPALFRLISRKNPTRWQALRITIRN